MGGEEEELRGGGGTVERGGIVGRGRRNSWEGEEGNTLGQSVSKVVKRFVLLDLCAVLGH